VTDEQPPTELVAGKYRLTRLLGRGGMGSVWEGVHDSLGSRVACKFIEPEFVQSFDAVTRFENEARAAASLNSKHVVNVYDHGVSADGRPYIVMEYLKGESLDARIAKLGTVPLQAVAMIVRQISLALFRAHEKGIIHRDLKPENVFLVWDDEDQADLVKVVDFGIAKFKDNKAGITSATKTGAILGTPYYMSPEQARGLKDIDSRSDIWSLGVIAYQALTGQIPFDGEAVGDLLVKICTEDPTPPSELNPTLPPAIDHWMARALCREPNLRFQDAREMAEALLTIAELPHRSTLGSTIGRELEKTALGSPAPRLGAVQTRPHGSSTTTGGVTRTDQPHTAGGTPQKKSRDVRRWLAAAAALSLLSGGIFAVLQVTGADESILVPKASPPVAAVATKASTPPPASKPEPEQSTAKTAQTASSPTDRVPSPAAADVDRGHAQSKSLDLDRHLRQQPNRPQRNLPS
jgi:serine/threonine protein kinase